MVEEGLSIQTACRILEVSGSGFHAWRGRAPSARSVRHAWLTDLIRQVHAASNGVYGARRVRAELTLGPRYHGEPRRGRDADETTIGIRVCAITTALERPRENSLISHLRDRLAQWCRGR